MNSQPPRVWIQRRDTLARSAAAAHMGTIAQLTAFSADADSALARGELDGPQWSQLKFSCSSLLINLGDIRAHRAGVTAGIQCARDALDRSLFPTQSRGLFALRDREALRTTRALFTAVGHSREHRDVRGRALCNLDNALDHSGRWLEARSEPLGTRCAHSSGNFSGTPAMCRSFWGWRGGCWRAPVASGFCGARGATTSSA